MRQEVCVVVVVVVSMLVYKSIKSDGRSNQSSKTYARFSLVNQIPPIGLLLTDSNDAVRVVV